MMSQLEMAEIIASYFQEHYEPEDMETISHLDILDALATHCIALVDMENLENPAAAAYYEAVKPKEDE